MPLPLHIHARSAWTARLSTGRPAPSLARTLRPPPAAWRSTRVRTGAAPARPGLVCPVAAHGHPPPSRRRRHPFAGARSHRPSAHPTPLPRPPHPAPPLQPSPARAAATTSPSSTARAWPGRRVPPPSATAAHPLSSTSSVRGRAWRAGVQAGREAERGTESSEPCGQQSSRCKQSCRHARRRAPPLRPSCPPADCARCTANKCVQCNGFRSPNAAGECVWPCKQLYGIGAWRAWAVGGLECAGWRPVHAPGRRQGAGGTRHAALAPPSGHASLMLPTAVHTPAHSRPAGCLRCNASACTARDPKVGQGRGGERGGSGGWVGEGGSSGGRAGKVFWSKRGGAPSWHATMPLSHPACPLPARCSTPTAASNCAAGRWTAGGLIAPTPARGAASANTRSTANCSPMPLACLPECPSKPLKTCTVQLAADTPARPPASVQRPGPLPAQWRPPLPARLPPPLPGPSASPQPPAGGPSSPVTE